MFKGKNAIKEAEEISESNNIIGKGTYLRGDLESQGNVRLEGRVEGNVRCKKKVAVGVKSSILGNLVAQNAELAGEIHGTVEVVDTLLLKSTCVIQGDIVANKLIVEPGAVFNGSCKMGVKVKEISLSDPYTNDQGSKEKQKAIA
jgi:cytoskeletal protein CcmA (bactofilin family)